jgi:indole-3-glycerol phosphate synthase
LVGLRYVVRCAELERVLKLDMDSSQVMLGINNRDLQTFKVDIENNRRIMESSAGQQVRGI